MEFVVSSLRYLQQEYKLGVRGVEQFSCAGSDSQGSLYEGDKSRLPSRCADTHPGLILVGHSFGGVLARAAMVAAAEREDVGECVRACMCLGSE